MKQNWTTTKLVALGAIAVLNFIAHLLYYSVLVASGSALTGLLSLVISTFFLTLAILVVDQLWSATLFLLLSNLLMLSAPNLLSPFINFIASFLIGIPTDLVYQLLRNKSRALVTFIAGGLYSLIYAAATLFLLYTVGVPGTSHLPSFLTTLTGQLTISAVMIFVGGFCGLAAYLVYNKLAKTAALKRIQGVTK